MTHTDPPWTALQIALVVVEVIVGIALAPILLPIAAQFEIRQYLKRRRVQP